MITIQAKFTGERQNLEVFKCCGIRYNSRQRFEGSSTLIIDWICEQETVNEAIEACMDDCDLNEAEKWGIELESFGVLPPSFIDILESQHKSLVEQIEHGSSDEELIKQLKDELYQKTGWEYL